MLTDRDLAVEYARRHHVRRRRWSETAAEFRDRVVHALYAAGQPVAAERVLLNDESINEAVIVQGTLGQSRGHMAVRQLAERIQGAVDQAHPPRRVLWPGSRPRTVHVNIDLDRDQIPPAGLFQLIIDRIEATVKQAAQRRHPLRLGRSRPLDVHVHVNPWPPLDHPDGGIVPLAEIAHGLAIWRSPTLAEPWQPVTQAQPRIAQIYVDLGQATEPEPEGTPLITDRDLAEEYAGQFRLEPRRDDETGAQFRERVARELYARGQEHAAQGVLFNQLTGGAGWLAEALLEHSGSNDAVRWIAENTQAALDQARQPRRRGRQRVSDGAT